ncbi:O-antigen ligase family protein [Falsiroseomonas sp.]|uniref:O-antigen ligase family protein n=1 Tax=Falsiroseomonas sp. TaxID=2870721 RepID=UPI0035669CF0
MTATRAPLALLAGLAAALLHLAGALKTASPFAVLPFDLTLAAFGLLLPLLALLAATRRWELDPSLALPLAAAALLPLWLVVAGAWTPSRMVAAAKLPEVVLAAPVMLAAGLLIGAEPAARRALCGMSMLVGLALAAMVGWSTAGGWALQAAMETEQAKLHHQLAGLAMAIAAGLAAVRAAEATRPVAALAWLLLVGGLAAAALVPGGRTALLALGLGVALAPALRLWLAGRRAAAAGWLAAALGAGLVFAVLLLLDPGRAAGLRTLERLTAEAGGLEARLGLWSAALDWAGQAAPLGLGTGGFTIAAGHGERRGLYPHNHALEALAEAGLPGLLLWLAAFGGGMVAAIRLLRAAEPGRAARIAAMVLPVAMTVMVSTDLGNRMAWFALGLALSLGVAAHRPLVARHV